MDSISSTQSGRSPQRIYKYDVFLSFRGETRNSFTDHLYAHLRRKGIFTFKDDIELQKAEFLSTQLPQAIRNSRVAIIVFSKDYAASKWCLEEMATIVDCRDNLGQTVFSVFYDVDRSHVRNHNGVYQEAFALHTANFPHQVERWKEAMRSLADAVGWDVRNKSEVKEIEKIIQEVIIRLDHKFSGWADDLVGIQSRVKELENLVKLSVEVDDFQVLGIWGMSGIGKTAHAKILYNRISSQFDACCFIEEVSKIYRKGGIVAVHKQILHQTLHEKNLKSCSPSQIARRLNNRLRHKKVLIVLDNVDQSKQMEELAIQPDQLRTTRGLIIITTRDKKIVERLERYRIHEVPLLTNEEARELFDEKVLPKNKRPSEGSHEEKIPEELIHGVLEYADRLPLAIRVLGSFLKTRKAPEWKGTLKRLRKYPEEGIMEVLRVSYEELKQPQDREIFLDSACFFIGEDEDYVKRILTCCGLNPDAGIPVLVEKSLVTIKNQEIQMHKLLQELGKKIVRGQFHEYPEKWSRLWRYKDFLHVMTTQPDAIDAKALVLRREEYAAESSQLRAEEFSKMQDLRLLILYHNNKFSGELNFLSNNLQYLSWEGYPFASLPSSFQPQNLVEMNLPHSKIKRLREGTKPLRFPKLRKVDLRHSIDLEVIPDFEGINPEIVTTGCIQLELEN